MATASATPEREYFHQEDFQTGPDNDFSLTPSIIASNGSSYPTGTLAPSRAQYDISQGTFTRCYKIEWSTGASVTTQPKTLVATYQRFMFLNPEPGLRRVSLIAALMGAGRLRIVNPTTQTIDVVVEARFSVESVSNSEVFIVTYQTQLVTTGQTFAFNLGEAVRSFPAPRVFNEFGSMQVQISVNISYNSGQNFAQNAGYDALPSVFVDDLQFGYRWNGDGILLLDPAPTPVGDIYQARFNNRKRETRTFQSIFFDRINVSRTSKNDWSLRSVVADTFVPRFNSRNTINSSPKQNLLFNATIPVGKSFQAIYSGLSRVTKSFNPRFNINSAKAFSSASLNFEFTGGDNGWFGGTYDGTLNPNVLQVVSQRGLNSGTSENRKEAGVDLFLIGLGVPDKASAPINITSVTVSLSDRCSSFTGVATARVGNPELTYITGPGVETLQTLSSSTTDRTVTATSGTFTSSSSTWNFSTPIVPVNDDDRIVFVYITHHTPSSQAVPTNFTMIIDNVTITVNYFVQSTGQQFMAVYRGGGKVNSDGSIVFNLSSLIADIVQVNYSGSAKIQSDPETVIWNQAGYVNKAVSLPYNGAEVVFKEEEDRWNNATLIPIDFVGVFSGDGKVSSDFFTEFNLIQKVAQSTKLEYHVSALVAKQVELRYRLQEFIQKNLTPVFNTAERINQQAQSVFNIARTVSPGPIQFRFNLTTPVGKQVTTLFNTVGRIVSMFSLRFRVRSFKLWTPDAEEVTVYTTDAQENTAWSVRDVGRAPAFTNDPQETDNWTRLNEPSPSEYEQLGE